MRVLVAYGSKRGGTEGIARTLGEVLASLNHEVEVLPARLALRARGFEAVLVGGALYSNRWHAAARRFVRRREADLRGLPVWFFSSGPLDESAGQREIPPPRQVEELMERVGALGHATFGGRLAPDARGFPASAMARERSGDWRAPERIRAWAGEVARALPGARPGAVVPQPGRAPSRLVLHALALWLGCAAAMGLLLAVASEPVALVVHAFVAPALAALVAWRYFSQKGAREPLPTALAFVVIVAALDLVVVAGLVQGSLDMFASRGALVGTWLPLTLVFLATWFTGFLVSTLPWSATPAAPGS
jgi:menaquinone-dependent protoporphyrinogen oxidase